MTRIEYTSTKVSSQKSTSPIPNITDQVFKNKTKIEDVAEKPKQENLAKEIAGRLAWSTLHSYKGNDPHWLRLWTNMIPKYCECSAGYKKILKDNPPNFHSPSTFTLWGCHIHNLVSQKLNKPTWSQDDFLSHWIPRQNAKFSIHCSMLYGGIERWAISLSKLAFGISSAKHVFNPSKDIITELANKRIPLCTLEESSYANKVILVSNDDKFQKPVGSTTVLVAHGSCDHTKNWVSKIHDQCDYLVGVSEEISEAMQQWTNRQTYVVENGADIERFSKPTGTKVGLRHKFNIPESAKVLCYTGRLTDDKGVPRLLKVMSHLPKDHYLILMGWGNVKEFTDLAQKLEVYSRCIFVPPSENQMDVLTTSDYFISLPETEGFGLAVTEALLLGMPVISTRTGIIKALEISNGPNYGPFIVESTDDPKEIAAGVHKARPVFPKVVQYYTQSAMLHRWDTFIDGVINATSW